jgi:hypothetical protein
MPRCGRSGQMRTSRCGSVGDILAQEKILQRIKKVGVQSRLVLSGYPGTGLICLLWWQTQGAGNERDVRRTENLLDLPTTGRSIV